MGNVEDGNSQAKYWMSLEQWRNDPEFIKMAESEFQSSPLKSQDGQNGFARREFLKLMGASLALTSFGCVRRTAQKIIPYAKKPLEIIHGLPNYYASSYVDGAESLGIVVTTRDGRPIKIEGNTEHPSNEGGMSVRSHAHIMRLYDPDRATGPKRNLQNEKKSNFETISVTWDKLDEAVGPQLKKGSVAVLTSSVTSPSTKALLGEFSTAYGAKVYHYDDISYEHVRNAQKACYGRDAVPVYNLEKAKVIVAVNNDFLGTWLTPTVFNKAFAKARKPGKDMAKLLVFESLMSLTGTNADDRFRIRPSQTLDLLIGLLSFVIPKSHFANDPQVAKLIASAPTDAALGLPSGTLKMAADALIENKGQSLVLAGGLQSASADADSIHITANLLNAALDNDGKTIEAASLASGQGSQAAVAELIDGLNKGTIKTVIIHGSNPVYSLTAASGLREALAKSEMTIYTGDRNDETGRLADYLACDNNELENWNDVEMIEGVYSIQQPTIEPLYDTRAFQDSLLKWTQASGNASARAKSAKDWHDYLRTYWHDVIYAQSKAIKGNFDDFWDHVLQSGVFIGTAKAATIRPFSLAPLAQIKRSQAKSGNYELSLYRTVGLLDQKLANVSWLQEFPDPVTKICWDNYLTFSPADAKREKVKEGQLVELKVGDKSVTVAAHIQPGQASGVLGLAVGYGRKGAGKVADDVGVNAFDLATWSNGQMLSANLLALVKPQAGMNDLACVQGHHVMEGRQIIVEETLAQYIKKPGSTIHHHTMFSAWPDVEYKTNKWGMSIDLNTCTGCGSCVIACQSENNIPTVGKRNVLTGREMHWIRIDRYYAGDPENPEVLHQPMLCQHCDNAPCETVCPVIATMHSDEGTNDMIYNRCVGTRYCSNNCPYKVRRFNWFDYTEIPAPKHLALNPEVTVRHRGVMEKCTFCIHRIRQTKVRHKVQDLPLQDGDIKTACQQSCPTHAITFGDTNNAESTVSKMIKAENRYQVLEELNTKPAVRYLTKIRNTDQLKGVGESYLKPVEATESEEGEHT
jgi:molybdopterin-containing oxidoreductase family iron-sulfur binding subunit